MMIKLKKVEFKYIDDEGAEKVGQGYVITCGRVEVPVKPVYKNDYKSLELLTAIDE